MGQQITGTTNNQDNQDNQKPVYSSDPFGVDLKVSQSQQIDSSIPVLQSVSLNPIQDFRVEDKKLDHNQDGIQFSNIFQSLVESNVLLLVNQKLDQKFKYTLCYFKIEQNNQQEQIIKVRSSQVILGRCKGDQSLSLSSNLSSSGELAEQDMHKIQFVTFDNQQINYQQVQIQFQANILSGPNYAFSIQDQGSLHGTYIQITNNYLQENKQFLYGNTLFLIDAIQDDTIKITIIKGIYKGREIILDFSKFDIYYFGSFKFGQNQSEQYIDFSKDLAMIPNKQFFIRYNGSRYLIANENKDTYLWVRMSNAGEKSSFYQFEEQATLNLSNQYIVKLFIPI